MKWDARLSALEQMAWDKVEVDDRTVEFRNAAVRRLDEMLAYIPDPFQHAVTVAIDSGGPVGESLREWLDRPFKDGSPFVTPDFRFPVALVEFLLLPPRAFWMGHSCKTCGLMVPVFLTWANDPDPPSSLRAFPVCPDCGGVTGYSA